MLTKVDITARGNLLTLELDDLSNGLLVEEIEGLDPVKATLVSSSFAQMDGSQYQSSRREPRNIKIHLGLESNYTTESVQDLRTRLYDFFMPKMLVNLRFFTSEGRILDILGRVESLETPLFTKEPKVDISILCFNPDFFDSVPVIIEGETVSTEDVLSISYEGTLETGILFTLNVDTPMSAFSIYHLPPDGKLRTLDFANPLIADDILILNSVPGDKYVNRMRSAVTTSVLYGISPQSNWIELLPGINTFRVYAEVPGVPYTLEYTNKYGGL